MITWSSKLYLLLEREILSKEITIACTASVIESRQGSVQCFLQPLALLAAASSQGRFNRGSEVLTSSFLHDVSSRQPENEARFSAGEIPSHR